jgi:cell division protein FtsZ
VQQACSIIQGAAHEDANIIFGAVLDEKMKDSVKITVIATGFREVSARRASETRHSFAAAHDDAMDFPEPLGPSQSDPMPELPEARMDERRLDERRFVADGAPVPMTQSSADVISLDSVRNAMVANFEQDDLDVPAFLRKRGEVM